MKEIPNPDKSEKLIPPSPKLRYIEEVLSLLHSKESQLEGELNWKDLHREVGDYNSILDLSNKIRDVVRKYVITKLPALKEAIPSIKDLPDEGLTNALANSWFEEIEEAEGQRREILLIVAAQVIKRIESFIYINILEHASESDLKKIGINENYRQLLIDVLGATQKSNPLFVRFRAYAQLSGKPPKDATPTGLYLPDDKKSHTIAELFPKETNFISRRFELIAGDDLAWINEPGGEVFKAYLLSLSAYYKEVDTVKAAAIQKTIEKLYGELVVSGFPILITSGMEGYYKPPYLDPELRVSLATSSASEQEESFRKMQNVMADNLGVLGVEEFCESVKGRPIRSVVAIGNFGANLTFSSVAQEDPAILLFINEQIRAYDTDFSEAMSIIVNTESRFAAIPSERRQLFKEEISRTNTVLHELSHSIYPDSAGFGKHLGYEPNVTIDEVKAETVYRALIPIIIEKGGLTGTKEQWADGIITSSAQMLKDQPEDDEYFMAATYTLNKLMDLGVVIFNNNKITIIDYEQLYEVYGLLAREVMRVYEDMSIGEKQAREWIESNCTPNPKLRKLIKYLKTTD